MALTVTLPRSVDEFAALPQTDWIDGFLLGVAATAERVAIPAGAAFVLFSCTDNFAAKMGDGTVVAAMPVDTTTGTGSMLNPTLRKIGTNTFISCVSDTANAKVSLEYFAAIPTAAS